MLDTHPGGAQAILNLGGKDATENFDLVHPSETIEALKPFLLGAIDPSKGSTDILAVSRSGTSAAGPISREDVNLNALLNLDEIEQAAKPFLAKKAWAYYYSAGDDLISKHFNTQVYRSIFLRPRVFVDCTTCDTETSLFGHKVGLPLFVSPTARARLGHPDGEAGIAEGCRALGVAQVISNSASQSPEEVVANASPSQVFGWQLYVQRDRSVSEDMLRRVNNLDPIKFIVLTVDAPILGNREDDDRADIEQGGVGRNLFGGTDPSIEWATTLEWLAGQTKKPILIKGIQTHEDALLAAQYAPLVKGIVLSNHGGRALDTAPPAVHTLLEIRKYCPHVFQRVDVWVDGGIKRGTDVVKALCLGAKAVGIGRPALWGLSLAGPKGVERTLKSKLMPSIRKQYACL